MISCNQFLYPMMKLTKLEKVPQTRWIDIPIIKMVLQIIDFWNIFISGIILLIISNKCSRKTIQNPIPQFQAMIQNLKRKGGSKKVLPFWCTNGPETNRSMKKKDNGTEIYNRTTVKKQSNVYLFSSFPERYVCRLFKKIPKG